MATTAKNTLRALGDTYQTTSSPSEDIRSRHVVDAAGEELGEVDDLIVDDAEHKVRFLRIASGGFLGIGQSKFLIPVNAVTNIDAKTVHVDQTRERIASAPKYDPEIVDDRYYEGLYGHYGYSPYWTPGYTSPAFPLYYP